MSYEIKELSIGGILDQAIRVTKDGLGVFLGIVCCLLVPLQLIAGIAQVVVTPEFSPDATPEEIFAAQASMGPAVAIIGLVSALASFVVQPLTAAALMFGISDVYLGQKPTVGSAFSRGVGRWGAMLWTTILFSLACSAGFLLLIIPGIIAMLWFYLHQPVVALEQESGFSALKRSRALMKGNLGKAFVIGFLVGIIVIGVSVCSAFIPQPYVAAIAAAVLQGLATVFYAAVSVVFYFSARCQHEAYDLKRLAEAVGLADESAPAGPAVGL